MMPEFGVWLKCELIKAGMKQRDLAKILGTTEVSISRWIHGERTPKQAQIKLILDYFNCHIEIVPNEKRKGGR